MTVTQALAHELSCKESLAHKRAYLDPTIEFLACALARSYSRAGAATEGQKFLHTIQQAAKPESPHPYGTELLVQLASAEASEQVARQTLSMVKCKSTAHVWRMRAHRAMAELSAGIAAVEREFSL